MASATANISKLEAEVPNELLTELTTLDKALKDNKTLFAQIKDLDPVTELNALKAKMDKLVPLIARQKSLIKEERLKSAGLAEKIGLDQRIAANIQKGREQASKNPQYGRAHSVDYMHEVANLNERQLDNCWKTVQKLREMLQRIQQEDGGDPTQISRADLAAHIQRFDKIFETVATQVYTLNESAEKLRDNFMEQQKAIIGPYGMDPFERRRQRQRLIDAYSTLKGVDAFPSPNAIMSLSEYLPKQQAAPAQPQFGATPFGQSSTGLAPFGTGGGIGAGTSLFGPKPTASAPAFSFNLPQQQQPGGASSSLFGGPLSTAAPAQNKPTLAPLFGSGAATAGLGQSTGAPSLFGSPQIGAASAAAPNSAATSAAPLFGAPASVASQPTAAPQSSTSQQPPPPFGFSNTLSSASSGTLFKGSASPQIQNKVGAGGSLFGGLAK